MVAPLLIIGEGFSQLAVLLLSLVVDDIMLVVLVLPLVVEGTPLLLVVIPLLRLPTSALLPVSTASSVDSAVNDEKSGGSVRFSFCKPRV